MPGTARRYRDPKTGRTFSDRQVRQFKSAGRQREQQLVDLRLYRVLSKGEADAQRRPSPAVLSARLARGSLNNFDQLVESYRERQRQVTGTKPTKAQALGARSRFWKALADLEHAPRFVTRHGRQVPVGPKSRAARALVDLGLRDAESTTRVGESPKPTARQLIQRTFRPTRGRV